MPVAFHEGTVVTIDGQPITPRSLENLVLFQAPAGRHEVNIRVEPTGIYRLGKVVTGTALVGLAVMMIRGQRLIKRREMGEVSYA